MAIKEYIGARYVPKFYDDGHGGAEWTSTVEYEPLTVVQYQGNSYTSRQYVPIGIDILNTDYWLQTGNWNSQVEQYRQEVATFDGRITANAGAIGTEVTARAAADTALSERISANTEAINTEETARETADTAIRNRVASLESAVASVNKINHVVMIGDSWGDGWNGSASITPWQTYMKNAAGITNLYEKHEGGAGFYTGGNSTGSNFTQLLNTLAGTMTSAQKTAVQVVIAGGGVNDRSATFNQIKSAISNFCNAVKTAFPNATILIAGLSCLNVLENWESLKVLRAYTQCGQYGASYITNSEYAALSAPWSSDGAHLTDYSNVGYYMAGALYTGSIDVQLLGSITMQNLDGSALSEGSQVNLFIDNNLDLISIVDSRFIFEKPISLGWNTATIIGSWSSSIPGIMRGYGFNINLNAIARIQGGSWVGCPVVLTFRKDGTIGAEACPLSGLSVDNIIQLNIQGGWPISMTIVS